MVKVVKISDSISRFVPNDIRHTNKLLKTAVNTGLSRAKRYRKCYNADTMTDVYVKTKSVARELKGLKFTKEDIPAITAVISSFVPFPGSTAAGYFLGKFLKFIARKF